MEEDKRPMGELGDEPEMIEEGESLLRLKSPLKVNGEELPVLFYDFDSLTARDLHEASKYLKQIGIPVSVPALDFDYQMCILHKAVKKRMHQVALSDLMRMGAADTMAATGLARNFLLDLDPGQKELGSETSSEEQSSN